MMDFVQGDKAESRSDTFPSLVLGEPDLLCFSYQRWEHGCQRVQQLFSRCARERRVFFVEEPVLGEGAPRLQVCAQECGVMVVVPHLPPGLTEEHAAPVQRDLLDRLLRRYGLHSLVLWYDAPQALAYTRHLRSAATVYDCTGALTPGQRLWERELVRRADLVFTSGQSLSEATWDAESAVHVFPNKIDAGHFRRARVDQPDPEGQAAIGRPRLGYLGVIDERIDLDVLAGIAEGRPDWNLVMLGPLGTIDPGRLPRRANIHYLGPRPHAELPRYLAGWDVALLPFARTDATRHCRPSEVLELLAAGRPLVSTAIHDVICPYGLRGLVAIADEPGDFIVAVECELQRRQRSRWLREVDLVLAEESWDRTWERMWALIEGVVTRVRC